MEWTQKVNVAGDYWWKRDATSRAELINLLDYQDGFGLRVLPFGKDLDERALLSEWLDWAPESYFWGPLTIPDFTE
jgi:hypothetical protein